MYSYTKVTKKTYYYRERGDNIPIQSNVANELLAFRGWWVYEETETLCIITK